MNKRGSFFNLNELKIKSCSVSDLFLELLSVLPQRLGVEIMRVGRNRRDFPLGLSEIRVRHPGRSSVVLSGENVLLFYSSSQGEMLEIYDKVLGGALYAHTDEIKRGFVSMPNGVRVGISASRRESGMLPSDISSFVFRLPSARSESAAAIFDIWQRERPRGMLIYSLPGGGKTSALRALARLISRELALRVAVIDERREFTSENYSDCLIDLLSGYEKAEGIEIAMRTLSPEVIIVDEIGSEREAESLISVGRGGVPIIASLHAENLEEALSRGYVRKLYENGFFETFIKLKREKGRFSFEKEM